MRDESILELKSSCTYTTKKNYKISVICMGDFITV